MDRSVNVPGGRGIPFETPIELGKVREFCAAVGHPMSDDGEAPTVTPPTFLISSVLWHRPGSDPLHGADFEPGRTLHAEQEFVFSSTPPVVGDVLLAHSHIRDVYEKESARGGRLTFVSVVTEYRRSDHRLVAEAISTVVEREIRGTTRAEDQPGREPSAAPGSAEAPPPPLVVGPVTINDFVRYQGASYDLSPLHHDVGVVRAIGYDKPFAPGMYPAGLLASWVAGWCGTHRIRRFGVRFTGMVWPGDTLSCFGRTGVADRTAETGYREVELVCSRAGTIVSRGWATFLLGGSEI
jgi:acyl dehydratase